jgi:hypothetical protein
VTERVVGCFAAQASANDWVGRHPECTQACCNGNGARTMYYVWQSMLSQKHGRLQVHLLMNRASVWADVASYIPYQGRVDVRAKEPCELRVRIPEWASPSQTRCTVEGAGRQVDWDGRYALVGRVARGKTVTLTFPISERSQRAIINGQPYTLICRGNEVVHIDPPGRYLPLYQRARYRQDQARTTTVTRFVADRQIDW